MSPPNVLITSAGRRNYLVRWFRVAAEELRLPTRVFVADASAYAPAMTEGHAAFLLPAITDPGYLEALGNLIVDHRIGLVLSLNDFELSAWSAGMAAALESTGATILCLPADRQQVVEDKYAGLTRLRSAGIAVPDTMLLADLAADLTDPGGGDQDQLDRPLVVKARYGSGSAGLVHCRTGELVSLLPWLGRGVRNAIGQPLTGRAALQAVVAQPAIVGAEYGLDVVNDFRGRYQATLVRRKLRMRAGETDVAQTEPPNRFRALGERLSAALGHRGLVDVDVMAEPDGPLWVIDINPRFGGGYPFCHAAGADVPAAYLCWLHGIPVPADSFYYRWSDIGSKYDQVAISTPMRTPDLELV